MTEAEKDAIRGMQEDLELIPRPYDQIAQQLGMSTDELFALAKDFQDRRIMRRYSAVLHHRRSGFRANAMPNRPVSSSLSPIIGSSVNSLCFINVLLGCPSIRSSKGWLALVIGGKTIYPDLTAL